MNFVIPGFGAWRQLPSLRLARFASKNAATIKSTAREGELHSEEEGREGHDAAQALGRDRDDARGARGGGGAPQETVG